MSMETNGCSSSHALTHRLEIPTHRVFRLHGHGLMTVSFVVFFPSAVEVVLSRHGWRDGLSCAVLLVWHILATKYRAHICSIQICVHAVTYTCSLSLNVFQTKQIEQVLYYNLQPSLPSFESDALATFSPQAPATNGGGRAWRNGACSDCSVRFGNHGRGEKNTQKYTEIQSPSYETHPRPKYVLHDGLWGLLFTSMSTLEPGNTVLGEHMVKPILNYP